MEGPVRTSRRCLPWAAILVMAWLYLALVASCSPASGMQLPFAAIGYTVQF